MRQPGQYVDSGGNAYASTQMQRQRMDHKSNNYQPRGGDHMSSENDKSYGAIKGEGQWRYDRDASSHMFIEGMHYPLPFFYCYPVYYISCSKHAVHYI